MSTNLQFIQQFTGDTVANFELTNIFDSKYDIYRIDLIQEEVSNDDYNYFRIINASGTDSGSNYCYSNHLMYAHTTSAQVKSNSTTTANYVGYLFPAGYDGGVGATIMVYNSTDSSSYTFFTVKVSSFANGVGLYGGRAIMSHKVEEAITGLSFQRTGNFNKVKANVYGGKK